MRNTAAHRSLAAEVRAVEEGHRAILEPGGSVRVVSDTTEGKVYRVTFWAAGGALVFTCTPTGPRACRNDHGVVTGEAGALPCKHAALAARRLEREGLAAPAVEGTRTITDTGADGHLVVPGTWLVTLKGHRLAASVAAARAAATPADVFEGLAR